MSQTASKAQGGSQKEINFDVFSYVHDSRQTYGLRAQEYTRYRRYCANHLRTVRKSAKMIQGTSKAYCKKEVTAEVASTPEHIEILILDAERAWAYAMDLRELYSRTEEPRQRYHLIRRLRAACKAGEQLAAVADSVCDKCTSLACYAYWLQIQAQLYFELEEWQKALDCAVFCCVISKQLGATGSSQKQALAYAVIETLDPIIRLAAYQVRMEGAQQLQPSAIATQWYTHHMKNDPDRVASVIARFSSVEASLSIVGSASDGQPADDEQEDSSLENCLQWRGGKVKFTSSMLSSLIENSETLLSQAIDNKALSETNASDTLVKDTSDSFKKIGKVARSCVADASAASAKVGSAATDRLFSAYLLVELYSVCTLHAISAGKHVQQADKIAADLGIAPGDIGSSFGKASRVGEMWFTSEAETASASASSQEKPVDKKPAFDQLAQGTQMVLLYDMARKSIEQLGSACSKILARVSPSIGGSVYAQQIVEEISTAALYYSCIRDYYSAALHAQPQHQRYLDSLVLLDRLREDALPRAAKAIAEAESKQVSARPRESAADKVWAQMTTFSSEDVAQLARSVSKAISAVHKMCVATGDSNNKQLNTKSKNANKADTKKEWFSEPIAQPAMVPNMLASDGSQKASISNRPRTVPHLVDLQNAEFMAVPIKPLFYDLAGPGIDFDMTAIEAKAGEPVSSNSNSSSKLGSIIGSLWGR
ncbi:signal recognition particle subunit srp68 [Coemansia erecta]|nr:signal recognition particle subunit srp68 [Coemansia erecta]KAJ2887892.1 signal recognition particle subunit srp68 [Coemansia asiatica]